MQKSFSIVCYKRISIIYCLIYYAYKLRHTIFYVQAKRYMYIIFARACITKFYSSVPSNKTFHVRVKIYVFFFVCTFLLYNFIRILVSLWFFFFSCIDLIIGLWQWKTLLMFYLFLKKYVCIWIIHLS